MRGPLKTKEELKEETGKILQEEQETFERAAERSAALEEKGSFGTQHEENA